MQCGSRRVALMAQWGRGWLPLGRRLGRPHAFTLIELLVVIAIISLLMTILMPALNQAKVLAQLTVCATRAHHLAKAGWMHAADHENFFPVAGWMNGMWGPLANPEGLGDSGERKYTYYRDETRGGYLRPAPTSAALGQYLQRQPRLTSRAELEEDLEKREIQAPLRCPGIRDDPRAGVTVSWSDASGFYWAPHEYICYGFNEAALGRSGQDTWQANASRVQGRVDSIKHPQRVMFFGDAQAREFHSDSLLDYWNHGRGMTLWDSYAGTNGSGHWSLFDFERHNGKMNIAFVDSHTRTINMTEDEMKEVGTSLYIFED